MVEAVVQKRSVLLLGEGNFSYALARLRLHLLRNSASCLHMVATSFDSKTDLARKYPESGQILAKMRQLGIKESSSLQVEILHDVDATRIKQTLPSQVLSNHARFDEVTFCHPHIGHEDLRRNSALVAHFFDSAKAFDPSLIQITLLQSQFDRWQVPRVYALNGLSFVGQFSMDPQLWELGYETRRHQSGKSFSTSKVGKAFTIQSMAYICKEATVDLAQDFVLRSGVAELEMAQDPTSQESLAAKYTCTVCDRSFTEERALKNHQQSHTRASQAKEESKVDAAEEFKCGQCDRAFQSEKDLTQHVKSKHLSDGKASVSADHKGITLVISDQPGDNDCHVCGQAAHGEDFLQPPVQLSLSCPYCERTFVNQRALSQHTTLSCKKRPNQEAH